MMERQDISILVVDDVKSIRTQVKTLLHSMGYKKVLTAETGQEALHALIGDVFQLIICDWHMVPPVDGLEVLKAIRENPKHYTTAFIMLTAEDTKEQVLNAITQGVDDYLIKPLTIEKLTIHVEGVLKKKQVLP